MKRYSLPLAAGLVFFAACDSPEEKMAIRLSNPSEGAVTDAAVVLNPAQLPPADWSKTAFFAAGAALPFQANDVDGDGQVDEIVLLTSLEAGGTQLVELQEVDEIPAFPKRTQAELSHKVGGTWEERVYQGGEFQNVDALRVPAEHTDHSFYIRYEGPGWESDKVGYRFYLDWRNATDIFGKTVPDMVLQDVGQDGFDSYHEMANWGMDVLKVGQSLGVGSFGTWENGKAERVALTDSIFCAVAANGPVHSMIRTEYLGWQAGGKKQDLRSELSITAGSRLTRHTLSWEQPLDSLCTGIVKLDNSELLTNTSGTWGYLATWGQQSLNNDMLGMAVLFRSADALALTADEHSHVVVLQAEPDNQLTYYFLGAWDKEPGGITTREAFIAYLDEVLAQLNQPLLVQYNP